VLTFLYFLGCRCAIPTFFPTLPVRDCPLGGRDAGGKGSGETTGKLETISKMVSYSLETQTDETDKTPRGGEGACQRDL
jgi:hypothetical protein